MFFSIIVFILIIWYNTNNTIIISKSILESISNDSIPVAELIVKKDSSSISLNYIDKTSLEKEILYVKDYILDANSISFFFEILTFFTLGLGIYLLGKVQNSIKLASTFSERLNVSHETGTLIRYCEFINYYSMSLKNETPNTNSYLVENMDRIHSIQVKIDEIIKFIEDKHIYQVSNSYERDMIIELLNTTLHIFQLRGLSDIEGYYKNTYLSIVNLTTKIKKMEIVK